VRIAALFGIERTICGHALEQRRAVRLAQTRPLIDDLRAWLEAKLAKVSGGSRIAQAIRYALKHWAGLTVFLYDGRVEIDSTVVERSIRPIALNRKNALFAGSDQGGVDYGVIPMICSSLNRRFIASPSFLGELSCLVTRFQGNRPADAFVSAGTEAQEASRHRLPALVWSSARWHEGQPEGRCRDP
jgi:transposase